MRTTLTFAMILVVSQSLLGCAARREAARARLPTAETVCVVIQGISDPGAPFLRRKAASYLAEEGFRLVEAGCDVTVTYTSFNHGQWELIERSLFGTKSSNAWRAEGVVALHRGTTLIVEDKRVDLRDYSTMQDLLDKLASKIVEVVPMHYRPVVAPKS
jgi:hypothetical protein